MLRRFSSTFKRSGKKDGSQNGDANGHTQSANGNGNGNGYAPTPAPVPSNGKAKEPKFDTSDAASDREGVVNTFSQFSQILHAAQRPMPDQNGDGTYTTEKESSGFMADLKNMGFKDLKTLKDVIEGKASGQLVDDKTYIMERVIQVCHIALEKCQ